MEANTVGFLLHICIEVPATCNFALFPSGQLGQRTSHAHAVVRQYALLLFTSILIAIIFLQRPVDALTGQVAGALAIYHIGPSLRSISRLRLRAKQHQNLMLSEPFLYLLAHSITGAALAHTFCTVTLLKRLPIQNLN